ncbi:MAG: hypothetical protein GMKNLPBB_00237 [Myxococcota bacterium]|nr:hypothetical protein [Myxococcota bacterium]
MPLGLADIRARAREFANAWREAAGERADAQTFWNEFFAVFGIRRRSVAAYEYAVRNLKEQYDRIDLLWKGMLLVEHKSRGASLSKAATQAMNYIPLLPEEERPRYLLVSDFARFELTDLDRGTVHHFLLEDFPGHVEKLGFIAGYQEHHFDDLDPVNLQAVRLISQLRDALEDGGYRGHSLERMLVRVLFCLFADHTGIFERNLFGLLVEGSGEDGRNLGPMLAQFFEILNTPPESRQSRLDETLAGLPFVNGGLFEEQLGIPAFNRAMRGELLRCTRFDWSQISPAIFGALFQSVIEPRDRRKIGAHYTSEKDIMKVIKPLFLDDLRAEFEKVKGSPARLKDFHRKLSGIRLLDPACGCGNFLVVAYRELRLLEMDVLTAMRGNQLELDIREMSKVDVDAMAGIEIQEWPCRIAEVALWLTDHQMNLKLSARFGQYFVRLPLLKSPRIVLGNALRLDWNSVLPREQCHAVLGNPPFVGAKYMSAEQRMDMRPLVENVRNGGLLDYVCGWYLKAAKYIHGTAIPCSFVSTNSICQGEQAGVLWRELMEHWGVRIQFGYQTFPWDNEASHKAHVHVVIIGFRAHEPPWRLLFELGPGGEFTSTPVNRINSYLVDGPNIYIENRGRPLCGVPEIGIGNKPIDDGQYLFKEEEKEEFLKLEPAAARFFRPWVGAEEFIHGHQRWCLYLADYSLEDLKQYPHVMERVKKVQTFRKASKSEPTKLLANTPLRFHVNNAPDRRYLVIPKTSSELRKYIPIGYLKPRVLTGDACFILPEADLFAFGILTSAMHMAWVRQVCGRLKSDCRYSIKLVYNNFPWPKGMSEARRNMVMRRAQAVLDVRARYPKKSYDDLYDPLLNPADLVKAHHALDIAVDRCYRDKPFRSDRERVEFLFELYWKYSNPLMAEAEDSNGRPRKRAANNMVKENSGGN